VTFHRRVSARIELGFHREPLGWPKALKQLIMKVSISLGNHVDNDEADALLHQAGAFRHERIAVRRPVLVRWADQLDRPLQNRSRAAVEDQHLYDVGQQREWNRACW